MVQTAPAAPAYRWSRARYEQAVELGLFADVAVELIGGQVVAMTPTGPRHEGHAELGRSRLSATFSTGDAYVRKEAPLALGEWDEPEPDLAVVVGSLHHYTTAHPTADQTLLVVEIADSTAAYDLGYKADVYAAAGILDYWVVLPIQRAVVVCREPISGPAGETMVRYRQRRTYQPEETIVPLAAPDRPIPIAALLL